MGIIGSVIGIFKKKCAFCGSTKNINSTVVMGKLYYYCDKATCRSKMRRVIHDSPYIK